MLSQLLNQMDEYLANRPFKRRWWSKRWESYMTIHPPLSKEAPLWKRNLDELRSLRLFDLTPEELGRTIECYWKKPRWRRWFSYFGMNKKIDVWNYYQRCLAYQAVRPDYLEQASLVLPSSHTSLFNKLALCLYQYHVRFETYLEKYLHHPQWTEQHFLEEIKAHLPQLDNFFLTKLSKYLKNIEKEGERFALKQQAEQEYQQVKVIMFRYYHQRLTNFFSQPLPGNLIPERANEVIQDEEWEDLEKDVLEPNLESDRAYVMVVVPDSSQPVSSSSPLPVPREEHKNEINSLGEATERIKEQRQCLESLVKKDALQKVEDLLQTSFNQFKTIIELHLGYCETVLAEIKGKPNDYDAFLKYLDHLQSQLKPLFKGGILLFHPDHMISSMSSQMMRALICRYSQCYIEQSRYYLNKFKNYPLRIKEFCKDSQTTFERQSSEEWLDITRCIEELEKTIKDLEQSFKDLKQSFKDLKQSCIEFKKKQLQDEEKLNEVEARVNEVEARVNEVKAKQLQDQEKLNEVEAKINVFEAKINEVEVKVDKLFILSTEKSTSNSLRPDENTPASSQSNFFKP